MVIRSHSILLCGLLLLVGAAGCATDPATVACQNHNDCDPGYHCDQGSCVSDNPDPDASVTDAQPGDSGTSCAAEELPFSDTEETIVIPDHARYMHVKLWGAGGNAENTCPWTENGAGLDGGQGGFTEAIFEIHHGTALAPGTSLVVIVGAAGKAGANASRFGFGVRGGGGLTGIFFGPGPIGVDDAADAVAVAGGGGSAGPPECHAGGPGNHSDSGGRDDMQGGAGEDTDQMLGGGGGHEGGPGGDRNVAATGGSGYVDQTLALDHRLFSAAVGDSPVPGSTDADYIAQGGTAGVSEQPGLAIIRFTCALPPPP